MVEVKIGKHSVVLYDAIDILPIARFHRYQKLLMVDSGIGGDIAAFDTRCEKMRRFLILGDVENAQKELDNLRQSVFLIQNSISPKYRAFAALVAKVDDKDFPDASDDSVEKILEMLSDVPVNEITDQLGSVKKKIDNELNVYFPAVFNDSEVREYYVRLRNRTVAILKNLADGKETVADDVVERLTTELITYSKPKKFDGSDGVEITFDRQFENLCLILSEQLHVEPKGFTVLEFYNAFEFVQERARRAERGANKAK